MNLLRWLLLSVAALFSAADVANGAPRLNVLMITVDDMNFDSVGAYGSPVDDITPSIDGLAAQGMRFEHAHVSIAICQPTRAVWMTGRYPHRSGALGFDRINRGVPTLLEVLHNAGYRTGILGKVGHVAPSRTKAWDMAHDAPELGDGRSPQRYYELSRDFLDDAKQAAQPFFLMANAHDPHRPFAGSAQEQQGKKRAPARRNSKRAAADEDDSASGRGAPVSRTYRPDEVPVPGFLPDLPDVRQEMAEYYTSVHRADETVGSVLRALDESGLAEQTLVIFCSDHGMPLPFAKTNCYYHSTRTPLVVRWPGVVQPGSWDRRHFIGGIDIAPTVLEAVGLPNLAGTDGFSILPVLRGESQAGREQLFTSINTTAGRSAYPMRALHRGGLLYIFNAWSDGKTVFKNESQSGLTMKAMRAAAEDDEQIAARVELFLHRVPEELYDYENDPDGLQNLIDEPQYQDELVELRRILLRQMEATDDPQMAAFRRRKDGDKE